MPKTTKKYYEVLVSKKSWTVFITAYTGPDRDIAERIAIREKALGKVVHIVMREHASGKPS